MSGYEEGLQRRRERSADDVMVTVRMSYNFRKKPQPLDIPCQGVEAGHDGYR
jgi:hypothetical protein